MTDHNPNPERPSDHPTESPTESLGGFTWSGEHPTPAADQTRPLPPFQQPAPAATTTAPVRRAGGMTAAVLAGSLLLGGAAGVGGAAWYDAWHGDNQAVSSGSSAQINNTNAADLPDGTAEKVAAAVLPSVVKINVRGGSGSGSGSGVVLSEDGDILTNNHVVAVAGDSGSITVNFNDGTTVRARVVGTDPVTDLAVIKAEGVSDLTPAKIGKSSSLKVGQAVAAIGSPYGLNATVTTGIVSALNRPVSVQSEQRQTPSDPFGFGEQEQQQQGSQSTTYPAIQTDAAINPGNSGGPLVDMAGQVIGVNSSIRTSGSSISGEGGSIGLGFAIPIDEALPIVQQILDGETPTHARLAITVGDVTNDTLAQGAVVQSVQAGGAAEAAGLEKGDVITKVNDDLIDGSESLVATIRGHRPDEKVTITYLRDGDTRTTTAILGSDAQTTSS